MMLCCVARPYVAQPAVEAAGFKASLSLHLQMTAVCPLGRHLVAEMAVLHRCWEARLPVSAALWLGATGFCSQCVSFAGSLLGIATMFP